MTTERPEGKLWATAQQEWICFQDEAENIGTGWRLVWFREGRKWAYVAYGPQRKRLRLNKWLEIKEASERRILRG